MILRVLVYCTLLLSRTAHTTVTTSWPTRTTEEVEGRYREPKSRVVCSFFLVSWGAWRFRRAKAAELASTQRVFTKRKGTGVVGCTCQISVRHELQTVENGGALFLFHPLKFPRRLAAPTAEYARSCGRLMGPQRFGHDQPQTGENMNVLTTTISRPNTCGNVFCLNLHLLTTKTR